MKTPESLPALALGRAGTGLVFVAIDRNELIDFLLRRDFGSLPPPVPKSKTPLDQMLDEARRKRDLSMAGLEDPRPAIERRRGEYEALSDESLLALNQAAKEEDEKQAQSYRMHAEAVRAGAWPRWAKKDLWSEEEFSTLCCGLIPDERGMPADPGRTHGDSVRIRQANDDIRRGTLSGALEFVPRSDDDLASRMYGTNRHYHPRIAVAWAIDRFESFPKELVDAVQKTVVTNQNGINSRVDSAAKDVDGREVNSMLRVVRALVEMAGIPERGGSLSIQTKLESLGFASPKEATIRKIIERAKGLGAD